MDKRMNPEVREPSAYMREPERSVMIHTIDDFDQMPEEPRYELQDGELIRMEAPTIAHQDVILEFAVQAKLFIDQNRGKCKPLVSPIAVQPDISDEHTLFQPDFIVVCDPDKMSDGRHVRGGPDWVVEVLSPSTRKRDMTVKKDRYRAGGVKEYWVVDIESETVIIFDFTKPDVTFVRSMREPIPVEIYDGKLKIDLSNVLE